MARFGLTIDGALHLVDVDADTPLLWVLRDELGLTGTKIRLRRRPCGAGNVLQEKSAVRSCL
ncbi:MAG TPA: hypothetical protein VER58_13135 [Thermoanaerobaculia bacterium]|nr:hypothetical protein [Thermoanaerobaculia bacterium]